MSLVADFLQLCRSSRGREALMRARVVANGRRERFAELIQWAADVDRGVRDYERRVALRGGSRG